MKRKVLVGIGLVVILIGFMVTLAGANNQSDLTQVQQATAKFHRIEMAQAAKYDLVPGLADCFNNPGVGGTGIHFINTDMLDLKLDALQPEGLVYVASPKPMQQFNLGAVEYIVPADKWDAAGNTQPPSVLGQSNSI